MVASASAQEPPRSVDWLEVRDRPLPSASRDLSAFSTVIEIQGQPAEFKTVSEVLSESVGLQVRRFGGLGDFTTVSIRGSSPSQVRMFLDGVPLTRARSETINLADLPLDPLDRIEVYRGTIPTTLPGDALGGVIDLVTRSPSDRPELSFLVGGGSFGTRKVGLTGSAKVGPVGVLAAFNYLGSEGDFRFDDDRGTDANPFDDRRTSRINNDFNTGDALLKAIWEPASGGRLTVLTEMFVNDQGVPGIGVDQAPNSHLSDIRSLSYLRYEADDFLGTAIRIVGTLHFSYEEERFEDRDGDLGLGNRAVRNRTFAGGAQIIASHTWGAHLLTGRLDLSGQVFVPRELLAPSFSPRNQSRIGLGLALGDTWSLWDDRLLLEGQFRFDMAADDYDRIVGNEGIFSGQRDDVTETIVAPRLGARFAWTEALWLKANVGRYGRIPNFSELFGVRGSVQGNPELTPETGVNIDAGFDYSTRRLGPLDRFHTEVAVFWRDVDDLIVLDRASRQFSRPRNLARAEVWGVESTLRFTADPGLHLIANYTFQDARDRSDSSFRQNKQLPGLSRHEAYARVEWRDGLAVLETAQPFYELSYTSGNFIGIGNFGRVPGRVIHTLGLRLTPDWLPIHASFEARNLSDNQVEDVAGFPLPGRSFFAAATYRWRAAP